MVDEVNIDLSNYRDRMGERVAPGRYRVQVEDAEVDTAKSGNTMINVWLNVMDGEFKGSTLMDRLVISEKSLFRVVGFMQAVGIPTPKKKLRVNTRLFLGKVLDVDVDDGDPYNGRVKSEVRGYLKVAGHTGNEAPSDLPLTPDQEVDAMKAFEPDAGKPQEVPEDVDLDKLDLG